MTKMKKMLSAFLAVTAIASVASIPVSAAYQKKFSFTEKVGMLKNFYPTLFVCVNDEWKYFNTDFSALQGSPQTQVSVGVTVRGVSTTDTISAYLGDKDAE